ncbi:MAG: hypothetical protein EAZ81_08630, partial [Verrucomicrobia bacterium]
MSKPHPPQRLSWLALITLLFFCPLHAQDKSRLNGKTYEERCQQLVAYFAEAKPRNANFPKEAMPFYAARLQLGMDTPGTLQQIEKMVDATIKGRPDPFNLHALMHCYFLHKDKLTPSIKQKIKSHAASWRYSKPIGVSLNYE